MALPHTTPESTGLVSHILPVNSTPPTLLPQPDLMHTTRTLALTRAHNLTGFSVYIFATELKTNSNLTCADSRIIDCFQYLSRSTNVRSVQKDTSLWDNETLSHEVAPSDLAICYEKAKVLRRIISQAVSWCNVFCCRNWGFLSIHFALLLLRSMLNPIEYWMYFWSSDYEKGHTRWHLRSLPIATRVLRRIISPRLFHSVMFSVVGTEGSWAFILLLL